VLWCLYYISIKIHKKICFGRRPGVYRAQRLLHENCYITVSFPNFSLNLAYIFSICISFKILQIKNRFFFKFHSVYRLWKRINVCKIKKALSLFPKFNYYSFFFSFFSPLSLSLSLSLSVSFFFSVLVDKNFTRLGGTHLKRNINITKRLSRKL